MAEQSYRINTANYLGIQHSTFKNKLMELALTKPSDYFDLREKVLEKVKTDAIADLYNTIFNTMTDGKDLKGGSIAAGATAEAILKPSYPHQEVTEIALAAAKTMDKIIDDVIEIILPIDYTELAKQRIARKSEGAGIQ